MTVESDAREPCADVIGQTAPFSGWPRATLLELASQSTISNHPAGTALITNGQVCDAITIPAQGAVISSVMNSGGRRVVFKFDASRYAYGLAPLMDGRPLPHDLLADGPVTIVRVPHVAIRAALKSAPALWESIALELQRRAVGMNLQMQKFLFDAPLTRAASLLLGLLSSLDRDGVERGAAIELRLSQERLAELLGTSRQWATLVVRELSAAGVVEWRYGRVTILDVDALRAVAANGIEVQQRK